jgi:hypothetical protein
MTRAPTRPSRPVRWSRRQCLRSLLVGSLGLPWLETFNARRAGAQTAPRPRFVVMFSPNGTVQENWTPSGTEMAFTLSRILSPLEQHRDRLVIIAGVDQQGAGGDPHQNGIGGMLTGGMLLPGPYGGVGTPPSGWAEGPSVDQRAADRLAENVPFRSLELGVFVGPADNRGRMIYRAANRPLPPREDPARVFDELFGSATLGREQLERRRRLRMSVLDHVGEELRRLSGEVSASDRQRLELHFEYLREVETRLGAQAQSLDRCELPARPAPPPLNNDDYPAFGELQLDLMAVALACEQTRVASLQWSRALSPVRFTWLGIRDEHHALSHKPDTDVAARESLTLINQWYAARFAGLLERLSRYDEGERTLLDNSLVLWCNELANGNDHGRENAPYVLAGNAAGALRTGRFLQYPGSVPHNNLLLSLLHLLGVGDASFGRAEWCTGPLSGLA